VGNASEVGEGIGAETSLKPLGVERRQRQPFLYAAKRVAPEFLTMNFEGPNTFISAEGLLSQIAAKVENRDHFRRLCGTAKAIAQVIGDDAKWSDELVAALANVEGELSPMEPIPAELLPQKVPRRFAAETKKGSRYRVGK
jgi:hypothetical protein